MGKSYRKPVVKEGYGSRSGKRSSDYWRRVRRSQGNTLRGYQYSNDWDDIDYKWHIEPGDDDFEKHKRK